VVAVQSKTFALERVADYLLNAPSIGDELRENLRNVLFAMIPPNEPTYPTRFIAPGFGNVAVLCVKENYKLSKSAAVDELLVSLKVWSSERWIEPC